MCFGGRTVSGLNYEFQTVEGQEVAERCLRSSSGLGGDASPQFHQTRRFLTALLVVESTELRLHRLVVDTSARSDAR